MSAESTYRLNTAPNDKTLSDSSADLETTIAKTGFGRFNLLLILLTFPVATTTVFVASSMSYVLSPAAGDLSLTQIDKATLQSAPYAGMIISGYFWGYLSDAFGRQKLLCIGFLIDFFLNIGTGCTKSLTVVIIFKFLSGMMTSGPCSIFSVYVSEVFPRQHRDIISQVMGVSVAIGSLLQSGIAMWLIPLQLPTWIPFKNWQLFTIFGGVPSLICGLSIFFLDESPKFLVDKGKPEKALEVCRRIYSINTGKPRVSFPVQNINTHNPDIDLKMPVCSRILEEIIELFKPPFLIKSLIAFVIFTILFSSQNILRLWMPEIYTLVEDNNNTDTQGLCQLLSFKSDKANEVAPSDIMYINMAVIHISCLICHLIFMVTVKCIKKKFLLIISVIVAGSFITIVPWLPAQIALLPISVFVALYEVCSYAFLGAIVQIFPTNLRAKGVSSAMVLGRVAILLENFLLSNILFTHCNYIFYTYAAGAMCVIILVIQLSFRSYDDSKITTKRFV